MTDRISPMRSSILALSAAALALSACTTTSSSSGGKVGVAGPRVGNVSGGAAQGEVQVQINAKAKLLFDDALKAWDAQKKSRSYDYSSLEKRFRAAADADPNLAEATYNLGVLAERQGKTKEAVALYKEALSRKPTLRQAAENLAVIAQNNGDEAGAVRIYQDIMTSYPDDASSRARLAEVARRKGDLDKAIELSREALFRDPKTLQAYKTMMLVYQEQGQYSMARLIALRATKLDDADPEIYYTVGLINLAEKDPLKAKAQFKKALEVRPDYLPAHYQLASMAMQSGNYLAAEEHLRAVLQSNGKNAEALMDLGVAYKGLGQLDKAMATYDEVQKLNSEMPELYLNRGVIIGLKGDPDKAIQLFKTYIARKGEAGLGMDHPVHKLIEEQEAVIKQREENKRIAEEVARMEAEAKKQEEAAAAEEKKKQEEELRKQQEAAKGGGAPAPAAKDESKPPEAKKAPAPTPAPAPAPAAPPPPAKKKGGSSDEPDDGL